MTIQAGDVPLRDRYYIYRQRSIHYRKDAAAFDDLYWSLLQQEVAGTWQTDFRYDANWSGTLRYRTLHAGRDLEIDGNVTPVTAPAANVVVPLGTLIPPYVPAQNIYIPALEEAQDNFAHLAAVKFSIGGAVELMVTVTGCLNVFVCGIIPLD